MEIVQLSEEANIVSQIGYNGTFKLPALDNCCFTNFEVFPKQGYIHKGVAFISRGYSTESVEIRFDTIDGDSDVLFVSKFDGFKLWIQKDTDGNKILFKKESTGVAVQVGTVTGPNLHFETVGIKSLHLMDGLHSTLDSPVKLFVKDHNKRMKEKSDALQEKEVAIQKSAKAAQDFCRDLDRLCESFGPNEICSPSAYFQNGSKVDLVREADQKMGDHLAKVGLLEREVDECLGAERFLASPFRKKLYAEFWSSGDVDEILLKRFLKKVEKYKKVIKSESKKGGGSTDAEKAIIPSFTKYLDFASFSDGKLNEVHLYFLYCYDNLTKESARCCKICGIDELDKKRITLENLKGKTAVFELFQKFARNYVIFTRDLSGKFLMDPVEMVKFLEAMGESCEGVVVSTGSGKEEESNKDEIFVKVAGGGCGDEVEDGVVIFP
jgi:hypothetical protein